MPTGTSTPPTQQRPPAQAQPVPPAPVTHALLSFMLSGSGMDPTVKAHVEAGRGGVVELDELLPERCHRVALDDPASTLLDLA